MKQPSHPHPLTLSHPVGHDRQEWGSPRITPQTAGDVSNPLHSANNGLAWERRDGLIALGLFLLALGIYVATLAPGLLEADSAELQTLASTLGYAHPTGYPVYLLGARVAAWLPVGDVAYRVNLWSAVCAAAAVGLLYALARVLVEHRWPAVAAAVALAVSPTFWSQAIIARVYPMGLMLMIAVLLCLVLWRRAPCTHGRQHPGWLFAAACLGGISIGVHSTQSLMAPAALLLVARAPQRWSKKWPAAIAGAVAGIAVTLAAYWLIDRADSRTSYFRTVISPSQSQWNLSEAQLDSFWGRVGLCLRPPQYTGLIGRKPMSEFWTKLGWYGGNLPCEFPWPWLVLAVVGVIQLGRRNGEIMLFLLLTFVMHLGFDLVYDMGGIHVLYLATYVPIALFGGAGIVASCSTPIAIAHIRKLAGARRVPVFLSDPVLALALVLWPLAWPSSWTAEGRRECRVPPGEPPFRVLYAPTCKEPIDVYHQRVRDLVRELEPGAVLFTGWDLLYPDYYVAHVEMGRTDLIFVQDYPQADCFQLADSAVEYAHEMASTGHAVYFTHIVGKIVAKFELAEVRRGRDTLYRLGPRK